MTQHPSDLKPRGVKAPLYLIPWSAVPEHEIPEALDAAASMAGRWPDGDPYLTDCPARPTLAEALASTLIARVGLDAIARAFEHGARKYARDNWRAFAWTAAARDEYFGAICRHVRADMAGEQIDPESGCPHLAHAGAGALIWRWHEIHSMERPDV